MANIVVSNLSLVGSELFSDRESYMTELADRDLDHVNGGYIPSCATVILTFLAFTSIL